jgi:hypothetical protein
MFYLLFIHNREVTTGQARGNSDAFSSDAYNTRGDPWRQVLGTAAQESKHLSKNQKEPSRVSQ